jgi:hypothetical protein
MTSIRVADESAEAPVVEKGRDAPFRQGNLWVYEVKDEVAKYWNKLPPQRRVELAKQGRKEKKDLRAILDTFVFRPSHTK